MHFFLFYFILVICFFVCCFVCLGGLLFLHTDSNILRDPTTTPKYSDTIQPSSETVLWEWASLITTCKWSEWSGQGTGWAKNNATEASDGTNSSVKIKSVMCFCFLIMITLHIFKMENSTVVSFLSGIKPTPWLLSVTQLIFFTHNRLKLVWLLRSHEEVSYLQHKQMHLQIKICHHFLINSFVSCQSFIYTWVREWEHASTSSKPYKSGRCIWKGNTRIFNCHTPIQHTPDRHTEWENAFLPDDHLGLHTDSTQCFLVALCIVQNLIFQFNNNTTVLHFVFAVPS